MLICATYRIVVSLAIIGFYAINALIPTGTDLKLFGYGSRVVVLVAFDANNATFESFAQRLNEFANALDCSYRQQLVTFYFGDLSTQIDCGYGNNLVRCINDIVVDDNQTIAMNTFQVYFPVCQVH
jgi:hypothetical protein